MPLPEIGYVLLLIGFVGLGGSVAALAYDSWITPWAAAAMLVAFGLSAACFLVRRADNRRPGAEAGLPLHPLAAREISQASRDAYRDRYHSAAR